MNTVAPPSIRNKPFPAFSKKSDGSSKKKLSSSSVALAPSGQGLAQLPVVTSSTNYPDPPRHGNHRPLRVASPLKRTLTHPVKERQAQNASMAKSGTLYPSQSMAGIESTLFLARTSVAPSTTSALGLASRQEHVTTAIPHSHKHFNHHFRHRYDYIEYHPLGKGLHTGAAASNTTLLCVPQHDQISYDFNPEKTDREWNQNLSLIAPEESGLPYQKDLRPYPFSPAIETSSQAPTQFQDTLSLDLLQRIENRKKQFTKYGPMSLNLDRFKVKPTEPLKKVTRFGSNTEFGRNTFSFLNPDPKITQMALSNKARFENYQETKNTMFTYYDEHQVKENQRHYEKMKILRKNYPIRHATCNELTSIWKPNG